ncbi:MAG: ATP-binding protein [Actinobacteria bacterium]|nr:MAG: ATP-binding protein [Actinomycetota bacterium]
MLEGVGKPEQSVTDRRFAAAEGSTAAPGRRHEGALRLDLPRDREAPAAARAAVDRWWPELAGGIPRLETLLLLVSEVVTNAVTHSRGPKDSPIFLTVNVTNGTVKVTVADAGEDFTPPPRRSPRASEGMTIGGYGLYVVDKAASRWGVDRDGGTRVWFEL